MCCSSILKLFVLDIFQADGRWIARSSSRPRVAVFLLRETVEPATVLPLYDARGVFSGAHVSQTPSGLVDDALAWRP